MKITVLTENIAGGKFLAEHGLSYLVELNNTKILFDTGHSDVFLKNAKMLGIDIENDVDTIVLSHGHWDHGDGLRFLKSKRMIVHPQVFMKRFRKNGNANIGLTLEKTEVEERFQIVTCNQPYKIEDNIIFLGEIPRKNSFESQTTIFVDENGKPDFVPDDSAIVVIDGNALFVISGCAHSGICNIIDHAKTVTGIHNIKGVIGGFHLKHNNKPTQQTIDYFMEQKIEHVYPSHCTELPALSAFYERFGIIQVKTGMVLEF